MVFLKCNIANNKALGGMKDSDPCFKHILISSKVEFWVSAHHCPSWAWPAEESERCFSCTLVNQPGNKTTKSVAMHNSATLQITKHSDHRFTQIVDSSKFEFWVSAHLCPGLAWPVEWSGRCFSCTWGNPSAMHRSVQKGDRKPEAGWSARPLQQSLPRQG